MDSYYGEITIVGKISQKVWEDLRLAIYKDTGLRLNNPTKTEPQPNYLVFDSPEAPWGTFGEIEGTCAKYGIPYYRKSLGEDPELLVFNPNNTEGPSHSYSLNVDFDLMTQAEELMELREALKEVTIQNAPTFINDKRTVYEKYAKHILSGKDLLGFMITILEDYLPPKIPDLPPFEVGD